MTSSAKTRIESDSLGDVVIPADKYYGAQTQRSITNFPIGEERMPMSIIYAITQIKKAAALTHLQLGLLSKEKSQAITTVCDEILKHEHDDQFPLSVWQSGSGTQSHMNVNEVITNRANELLESERGSNTPIDAHDDMNKSQSTNDVFSSSMQIATLIKLHNTLLPALIHLKDSLLAKENEFSDVITIGRTHMGDAVPLYMGQRFSGYVSQLTSSIDNIMQRLRPLRKIPIGGTAVGTGVNAPEGYAALMVKHLTKITGQKIENASNFFSHQAAHDVLVECSGTLNTLACALIKIANDFRLMSSGPRCGLHEIDLPANEPGSTIMPGKVNPTQCEALIMVATRVQGNHTTISNASAMASFDAHSFRTVLIYSLLQSIQLLSDAMQSFADRCVQGLTLNLAILNKNVEDSLALATILNTKLGYEAASKIAKKAYKENISLKQSSVELGLLTEEECDKLLDPRQMIP
ncbi:class II fumarate hydratase [Legionella yabuuchiae]|uniref:class II fumarate hydratase n=1 Tax=Legionella yabuuchiae TaxID=376727 RepID=UPI00105483AC|nr:class II fumarate hydratase [Legionella yabuuchiae]